jgi:hypothetical protein
MLPSPDPSARDYFLLNAGATDFPFNDIDRRLIDENPDHPDAQQLATILKREARCSVGGEIILKLLEVMLPSANLSQATPQAIGLKVLTILWMLQTTKQGLGSMSLAQIASKVGVTRAILSHWAKRFEKDLGGFHSRGMKGVLASQSFVESSKRGWKTRRSKQQKPDGI